MSDEKFDKQVRVVLWLGAICLLLGVLITHYWENGEVKNAPVTCTEDRVINGKPCWDCETMGNLICGGMDK
jgi:hypothetical protein